MSYCIARIAFNGDFLVRDGSSNGEFELESYRVTYRQIREQAKLARFYLVLTSLWRCVKDKAS